MKEVKIVRFNPDWSDDMENDQAAPNTRYAEKRLTELVNEGWNIVSSSGASFAHDFFPAFIVLVRDLDEYIEQTTLDIMTGRD